MSDAIDWAEQIVEEVAQTQRIKDILDFVNQRKDFLVQYTGQNIHTSLNQMSDNAKDMAGQMKAIKNLSLKLKDQATSTKSMVQNQQWDNTMTTLIKMLEEGSNESGVIRQNLEKISRDLN